MNVKCMRLAIALLTPAIGGLLSGNAIAQQASLKERLVGEWVLISVTSERSDKKIEPYGPTPKGYLTISSNGRFSTQVFRPGTPNFASNDRTKGTAEENQAVVQNSISYFGTYEVDEKERLMNIHIEQSTFPNYNGENQKRFLDLNGDDLKITNPNASSGGTFSVMWKRAK